MLDQFHIIIKQQGKEVYRRGPVELFHALGMLEQQRRKYMAGYEVGEKDWRLYGCFQIGNGLLNWINTLRRLVTPTEYKKQITNLYQIERKGHVTSYFLHQSKLHLCN